MRIAILKTGRATPTTAERRGDYDVLIEHALAVPEDQWDSFDCEHGVFPEDLDAYDAFVLTGSKHSVTEDEPWIHRLFQVLRDIHERRRRILGICFGHQAVAMAMGGKAEKSRMGWELGIKNVFLTERSEAYQGLTDAPNPLRIYQTHQDEVTELPPGAEHLAFSERTPYEMFAIGDNVLCLQGHPEYDEDVMRDLLERWAERFPQERVREGLESLARPAHNAFLRSWLAEYLRGAPLRAKAAAAEPKPPSR